MATEQHLQDYRSLCYGTLVRTLSNLLICCTPPNGYRTASSDSPEVFFTTPEAGFYHLEYDPEQVYQRMLPIVGSHYAIENRFSEDLPERLWKTSPIVEQIKYYAKELDNLGVLPLPFPLKKILSEEDMRHIFKIYGITGLSYGNLSSRERVPELSETTFWMTGRGVDKANLSKIGKDVLLVKGFDYESGEALLSVPRDYDQAARVSVDAVEHELIYRTFLEVGAIVHVHAWMKDILCTRQNYPCGTRELAEEVAGLLQQTGNPSRAVVGLKNHGLTITGPNLADIFERIRGNLQTEVPMFS
ncbi:MAG: Ribulose-5-phosphate 4-epimerase/Fuculose-1-phosphate aldolase [Bacteroidetes bacterium]|nr:Ribulose-5-phosphate 4-epimerase/Fuculose-1-phosphate aldolase [Bacteroidota bacterium]